MENVHFLLVHEQHPLSPCPSLRSPGQVSFVSSGPATLLFTCSESDQRRMIGEEPETAPPQDSPIERGAPVLNPLMVPKQMTSIKTQGN